MTLFKVIDWLHIGTVNKCILTDFLKSAKMSLQYFDTYILFYEMYKQAIVLSLWCVLT